ncbi:MAG: inositol oxygenase family protein [Candidatus Hydrogenedentota bacterium]
MSRDISKGPLESLEVWEDDLLERYPEKGDFNGKAKDDFRNYDDPVRDTVAEFYRLNHIHQTLEFARGKRDEYAPLNRKEMGLWEACEYLNELVDDSDPDTDVSQIEHLLQTAEAIRADGHPRWFILTGLIHDLGKILCFNDEPQWAVVGDTFPLGCAFSDKIVYPKFFADSPDLKRAELQTECGIYEAGCGLDKVTMSWGHDEYMYLVTKDYLPEPARYIVRYHSFYSAHRENAYEHLMTDHDKEMFKWVRAFNPYDLYSKSDEPPKVKELKPFYQELIAEFFPEKIRW